MVLTHTRSVDTLAVTEASKTFGGIRVLDRVGFTLQSGQVCALIGQNGCGKSTLIKILSGFHQPDPGIEIRMGGADIGSALGGSPGRTGMAFIHQDLALVESMTICENLRINRFSSGPVGRIRWSAERAVVRSALDRVGLLVSPDATVGSLSVTERALVAIARGLTDIDESEHDGRLLVLDEPTAYLPAAGVERLFEVIRGLAEAGTSVLFVSHRLDEVLDHCDRVLVLRNGRLVADRPLPGEDSDSLLELMLGRPPEGMYPDRTRTPERGAVALRVTGLAGRYCEGVDFEARGGEVVGFVGLPGGGYDEIPYLLCGASRASAGTVEVAGRSLDAARLTPGSALRAGVALLPADRKGASGAVRMTAAENMTLPTLHRFTRWRSVLRHRGERQEVDGQLDRFDVRPRNGDLALALMSGGNQQKVLLAKWILAGPDVLALHEPTQGVDVGAKKDVFAHLATLAEAGKVVLVSSVEHEDLAHLCDRVHVVQRGRVTATLEGRRLTAHALAAAVYAR